MNALHFWLGHAVVILGVAALGYALWGMAGKRPYKKRMWDMASAFVIGLYLQIVTGFFVIFSTTNRSFDRSLGFHMVLSMAATALAHFTYSVSRRRPREDRTYSTHVWGVGIALALLAGGILVILVSNQRA